MARVLSSVNTFDCSHLILGLYVCSADSQQKVVLRVPTMTDDKAKQKAIEAVADIYGNSLRLPPLLLVWPLDLEVPVWYFRRRRRYSL